jgi:hypothetical protein
MSYYDGNSVTALWNYAQRYSMSDNSHGTVFGPSAPGHIDLVSGQTHGVTNKFMPSGQPFPPHMVVDIDYQAGNGKGTLIDDSQPLGDDCSSRDHFGTKNLLWFGLAMVIVFGVVHALFYGAQGTPYSSLYPTRTRYTGLSFVYQFSGIFASGVTPMILTALIAAAGDTPWLGCTYLVATAAISVVATALIRERDLHLWAPSLR